MVPTATDVLFIETKSDKKLNFNPQKSSLLLNPLTLILHKININDFIHEHFYGKRDKLLRYAKTGHTIFGI